MLKLNCKVKIINEFFNFTVINKLKYVGVENGYFC